ncbi:MAG: hypothetical protein COT73_08655 [Bdellovibrio sp. CG10_big_fil_rev_8_21_14_0_10_47_8]|nr:MAG: hypothetical protein COT73_08655 [Bdellovibrio sp. CG10_big_fil_rev_8_21_14_0_10_47_8]
MKKALVLAAVFAVSASASAAVKLGVRSDYMNTMKTKDTSDADIYAKSQFVASYARLSWDAKLGSSSEVKTAFNLRNYESMASGTSLKAVTTPESFVEYMYLAKKMNDWEFTAGKIEIAAGGFESDADNAGDNYVATLANGGLGGIPLATQISGSGVVATPDNSSGLGVGYAMGDHKFVFQTMNQTNSAYVNTTGTDRAELKRHNYGLDYRGAFGGVALNAAYYVGASDTIAGTNTTETYTNLGVMGDFADDFHYTVEYLVNKSKTDDTDKTSTTSSVYGQLKYTTGMWTPLARYESSENKIADDEASTGSFKRTAFTVGLEIKPVSDENFRYHLVYASTADKYGKAGLANDKINWSQVIAGIKYEGDFLK